LAANLYWKLAVLAAVAVLAGFSGFKVGNWRCAAQQAAAIDQIRAELGRQAAAHALQQEIDAKAARRLSDDLAASRRFTAALRRELEHANLATGDCDRPFGADFARLFNDAVHAAGASPPAAD